ncbi:hypothetical protein LR48_Vigan08g071000 [Vigna angularis]|uniref:Uncharacterized protein n=1 Tax=Phaseolus angularis TaxID=3914 RepID=A0A0L9V4F6_PHAAN|nr:hypothetical protein LR48_Vigan08g071000 [Vigna angularis]
MLKEQVEENEIAFFSEDNKEYNSENEGNDVKDDNEDDNDDDYYDCGDLIPIATKTPSLGYVSIRIFHEVLALLDQECQACIAAENTKSKLQVSFNRLKTLANEAIKKHDEFGCL